MKFGFINTVIIYGLIFIMMIITFILSAKKGGGESLQINKPELDQPKPELDQPKPELDQPKPELDQPKPGSASPILDLPTME
jgi:hypothetical protein